MAEKTSAVLCVLNTPKMQVNSIVKSVGLELEMVYSTFEPKKKTVYGFESINCLLENMDKCKRPPILWEMASVIYSLKLNHKVVILDANIYRNGLVAFQPLSEDELLKYISMKFVSNSGNIKFNKANTKQFGNNSFLTQYLNAFLATLPELMHEPVLIALLTSFETGSYKVFDKFAAKNRIITNENRDKWIRLVSYLTDIKDAIALLFANDTAALKKLDEDTRASLARLRFLRKHYTKQVIEDYLDVEANVVR